MGKQSVAISGPILHILLDSGVGERVAGDQGTVRTALHFQITHCNPPSRGIEPMSPRLGSSFLLGGRWPSGGRAAVQQQVEWYDGK